MIFKHLDVALHVAYFAAAHPALASHGLAQLISMRERALTDISWARSKIALVGDYLDDAEHIPGLLTDALRARMHEAREHASSEDYRRNPSLYNYIQDHFGAVCHNTFGPWESLEREEKEATANGTAVVHECTPSSMVKLGLDIQCTQYARLSLSGYWVI